LNPLDEYFMEKSAINFGAAAHQAGNAARGVAGSDVAKGMAISVGATAALGMLAPAVQKVWGAMTKGRDFKEMMGTNPDLRDIQQQDPRFFGQAYSSLRRVNPTFGGDPIIAGSYMRKMMANKDAAGLTLAQTVKAPDAGYGKSPINMEMTYSPKSGDEFPTGFGGKGKAQF